jgi:hypothetical protein
VAQTVAATTIAATVAMRVSLFMMSPCSPVLIGRGRGRGGSK